MVITARDIFLQHHYFEHGEESRVVRNARNAKLGVLTLPSTAKEIELTSLTGRSFIS